MKLKSYMAPDATSADKRLAVLWCVPQTYSKRLNDFMNVDVKACIDIFVRSIFFSLIPSVEKNSICWIKVCFDSGLTS